MGQEIVSRAQHSVGRTVVIFPRPVSPSLWKRRAHVSGRFLAVWPMRGYLLS